MSFYTLLGDDNNRTWKEPQILINFEHYPPANPGEWSGLNALLNPTETGTLVSPPPPRTVVSIQIFILFTSHLELTRTTTHKSDYNCNEPNDNELLFRKVIFETSNQRIILNWSEFFFSLIIFLHYWSFHFREKIS